MRKIFLGILLTLPFLGMAQDNIIYAPKTDILLKEESVENKVRFLDRMKLAIEQSELLMTAKLAVEVVSDVVISSVQAKRLAEHQKACYKTLEWVVNDIDENDYANAIIENSATEIIDLTVELEENIVSTTEILSSDFFNMEDSERLKFLRTLNEEVTVIENKLYRLQRKNKRYNDLYQYYNELAKK